MRDIKCRGQRADGKWVYGYLVKDDCEYLIGADVDSMFDVVPNTIGQFTGKYDVTTVTEIYEGDILYSSKVNEYFVVEWDKASARFTLKNESATADWHDGNEYEFDYEVVGNIYDDPELMEGE
jgi:hypothetical protein